MNYLCPKCKNKNGLLKIEGMMPVEIVFDVSLNKPMVINIHPEEGAEIDPSSKIECYHCGYKGYSRFFEIVSLLEGPKSLND